MARGQRAFHEQVRVVGCDFWTQGHHVLRLEIAVDHATAAALSSTWGMVPESLRRALLAPVPAVATDRGAVVLTPAGVLELRQISTGLWAWEGERTGRAWIRAPRA